MNFSDLVNRIRTDRNLTRDVPSFDPENGNESAKFLFLLEAPGPKAVDSDRGMVSFNNPDATARNLRSQLEKAGIGREEIALWNIVPWFIGNNKGTSIRAANGSDIEAGIKYLEPLVLAMQNLRCVILVGAVARRAHVFLSHTTTAHIVSCHHTSAKVQNSNRKAAEENIEVFRFIKRNF
jgi:uracil-DNA glycosylase